jgi:hypothetical protein
VLVAVLVQEAPTAPTAPATVLVAVLVQEAQADISS